MQKSQTHTVVYAVGTQYTVGTQYAVGTQYTVGVSAKKVNSYSGLSKYGWWGLLPLVQKVKPTQWGTQYTVGAQYTVGVSGKGQLTQ